MGDHAAWLTKVSGATGNSVSEVLRGAPAEIRGDREVVLTAVGKDGLALQYAAEALQADKEIVLAAVKQSGDALREADELLLSDKEVVLAAVKQNGGSLIDASAALQDDQDVVLAAVSNRGESLAHASANRRGDLKVVMAAAVQDVGALNFAAEALRKDKEAMLSLIKVVPEALKFAAAELTNDAELVECSRVRTSTPSRSLKERLHDADNDDNPRGFDTVLGDYLIQQGSTPDIPQVVDALFSHLKSLMSSAKSAQLVEALIYTIFLFSVSTSQDAIQLTSPTKAVGEGSRCALVLGFGGGNVQELSGQVEFYSSHGFKVVAMTPCLGPQALAEKQKHELAEHLRDALVDGASFVVHVCSNVGMGFWINLMGAWMQDCREAPWSLLPDLKSVLKCLVIDCAPFVPAVLEKQSSSTSLPARRLPPTDKGLEKLVPVMLGCMGGLCRQYAPHINPIAMSQEQRFGQFLRGAAKNGSILLAPAWPEFGDYAKWEALDNGWTPPLPRLFLHSAKDRLFPPAIIQAYIEHTKKYNATAMVLVEKCESAPHCKLWEVERVRCAAAVQTLLAKSGVIPAA